MQVEFRSYSEDHVGAVRAFNRRLEEERVSFSLHETAVPIYPDRDGTLPFQEYVLAVEDDAVRGGYQLKRQAIALGGRIVPAAALQLPVSEGVFDGRYALVGVRMVQDALRRAPLLYALGMGSGDSQFARMLAAMGWKIAPIPLYARVVHPFRFLRNARALRRTRARRLLLDAAAFSGVGWAMSAAYRVLSRTARSSRDLRGEVVEDAGSWADELWERCRGAYALAGVRDRHYLDVFFRRDTDRFGIVKVFDRARAIGWAVTFVNDTKDHKHFGDLRVGSIVDVLAEPDDAPRTVRAVAAHLERAGADLILTNQSHAAWGRALAAAGFRRLPSNFMFGVSRTLAGELGAFELGTYHMNRGDAMGGIMDSQLWGDHPVRHVGEPDPSVHAARRE